MKKMSEVFLYDSVRQKDPDYNMQLVFPGCEAFAMSSLGYLWMFKTIDEIEDVNIERVYSDSKQTKNKMSDVNLLGFSFSFDMDFLEIFKILDQNNIPLKSAEREENFPLIFAGGPVVTANPEPYSGIFDFFVIGDGEDVNLKTVNICKSNKDLPKKELLKLLSQIEGIYVPSLKPKKVKKITKRLETSIYTPILSEKSFFPNTFIIEVARGCANRCGFCLASYLNLPLRFMPYEDIIKDIELGLSYTNKIALLGAQLSAHPHFSEICKFIYDRIQNGEKIEMSVSSLRVDSVTPEILRTLCAAGQKNITLAVEAGSERLRRVINKNLTEKQIMDAVETAVNAGLKGFKFYGMLGLPTETQEDLDEMVALAAKIKNKYKGFDISFGFSTFVPKPHTPFQRFGREDTKTLEHKSDYIKRELHKIGVSSSVSSVKWDYWQAVLSRGDNSFTDFLIETYKLGGKLGAFKSAAKKFNINTDLYALENYTYDKKLPWDFIEMKPGKEFLQNECIRLVNNVQK